jgi:uncharacterized protein (DUF305 family)
MKNTNVIFIAFMSLVVGAFLGSYVSGRSGEHTMKDGSKMAGMNHSSMSMDSMMEDMKNALKGKEGDEFDKEFLNQMIVHHEGAVVMAQDVLEKSKRKELINLANEIISAQNKEIEMMKNWQNNWFK